MAKKARGQAGQTEDRNGAGDGQGESVVVLPKGTMCCGGAGGTFRRAAFQAAIDAVAPVRPVTFSYSQRGQPSTVTAFVGDSSCRP